MMNTTQQRVGVICLSLFWMLATSGKSLGAENIINPTPVGGTDLNQALLPPPGFYLGVAVLPYVHSPNFDDASGNALPHLQNIHSTALIGALGGIYVYPWKVFQGSLATSLQLSDWSINLTPDALPTDKMNQSGFGDIYSDIFLWSRPLFAASKGGGAAHVPGERGGAAHVPSGLTVSTGLALKAPTGNYNPQAAFNVGSNLWIFIPNVGMTYDTGPKFSLGDDTQVSARAFFALPTTNPATHYSSGKTLDIDWSVSQVFKQWQVGIAGYYTNQVSDDSGTNAVSGLVCPSARCVNGNRSTQLALGPVIAYTIPTSHIQLKLKYSYDVLAKNNLAEQYLVLSVAFRL